MNYEIQLQFIYEFSFKREKRKSTCSIEGNGIDLEKKVGNMMVQIIDLRDIATATALAGQLSL